MESETAAVERVFREEYGRLIASLVRRFGDIDIAEEAAGEALVAALERWPESPAMRAMRAKGRPDSRSMVRSWLDSSTSASQAASAAATSPETKPRSVK